MQIAPKNLVHIMILVAWVQVAVNRGENSGELSIFASNAMLIFQGIDSAKLRTIVKIKSERGRWTLDRFNMLCVRSCPL